VSTVGRIQLRLGAPNQAEEHHRLALEMARSVGARQTEIGALLGLSAAYRQADRRAAEPSLAEPAEQALALATASGYRLLEGPARIELAAAQVANGGYAEAAQLSRQALTILRETGQRPAQVDALVTLGRALNALTDPEAGAACWQEALDVATDIDGTVVDEVRHLLTARQ
jgi:tetratricopeptide (TPR) repeat protein